MSMPTFSTENIMAVTEYVAALKFGYKNIRYIKVDNFIDNTITLIIILRSL